jgi:hypothetical protein
MKELLLIQKELKSPKNQHNAFGKYQYRSCEDILEAVKPLLDATQCILTLSDTIEQVGERYYIKAVATLTNPEGIAIETSAYAREAGIKKGMDDSQITGSTSSYARKYALNGLFCIDDTKDADTQDNTPEQKTNYKAKLMKILQEAISEKPSKKEIQDFLATHGADWDGNTMSEEQCKDYLSKILA